MLEGDAEQHFGLSGVVLSPRDPGLDFERGPKMRRIDDERQGVEGGMILAERDASSPQSQVQYSRLSLPGSAAGNHVRREVYGPSGEAPEVVTLGICGQRGARVFSLLALVEQWAGWRPQALRIDYLGKRGCVRYDTEARDGTLGASPTAPSRFA